MNTDLHGFEPQRRRENKARQSDAFFIWEIIVQMARRSSVLKIAAGMVRQPKGGRFAFPNRIWTRRRWRPFRPIWNPTVVLRFWFIRDLNNLVRPKSGVPNHLPFRCQTLQMDQSVLTDGFCVPTIIADLYLRCRQFNDALLVGGQFLYLVDGPVLFAQQSEILFISPPGPTQEKEVKRCDNQNCQNACQQRQPLAVVFTNRLKCHARSKNNEHAGQQFDERIGVSRRTATLKRFAKYEHD